MEAPLEAVTVKLPPLVKQRVKDLAKKNGKKLQAFYAELLQAALRGYGK